MTHWIEINNGLNTASSFWRFKKRRPWLEDDTQSRRVKAIKKLNMKTKIHLIYTLKGIRCCLFFGQNVHKKRRKTPRHHHLNFFFLLSPFYPDLLYREYIDGLLSWLNGHSLSIFFLSLSLFSFPSRSVLSAADVAAQK